MRNLLIGGGKKSITLQPVSLTDSTGVGVAGGLGYLYLEPDKAVKTFDRVLHDTR